MNSYINVVLANSTNGLKHNFVLGLSEAQFQQCTTMTNQARIDFLFQMIKGQVLRNEPNIWYIQSYQTVDRRSLAQLFSPGSNCILLSDNLRIRCEAEIARSTCDDHYNGQVVYPLETETVYFHINSVMADIIGINQSDLSFERLPLQYKTMILNQINSYFEGGLSNMNVEWMRSGSKMLLRDSSRFFWQVVNVRTEKTQRNELEFHTAA